MKKYTLQLFIESNENINEVKLSTYLHGMLMNSIEDEYADEMHQQSLKPYSTYCLWLGGNVYEWTINLLTERAIKNFGLFFNRPNFEKLNLNALSDATIKVLDIKIEEFSESALANLFYNEDTNNSWEIEILTPTAFKRDGEYFYFPDPKLIIQSAMIKYSTAFEGETIFDQTMLDEMMRYIRVTNFKIRSKPFYVHGNYVPGFVGKLSLKVTKNNTLARYIHQLLRFAEYSGIGIKSTMGMGAVNLKIFKGGTSFERKRDTSR